MDIIASSLVIFCFDQLDDRFDRLDDELDGLSFKRKENLNLAQNDTRKYKTNSNTIMVGG
jgi:hypothetical protein